jgi:hypothetical protein
VFSKDSNHRLFIPTTTMMMMMRDMRLLQQLLPFFAFNALFIVQKSTAFSSSSIGYSCSNHHHSRLIESSALYSQPETNVDDGSWKGEIVPQGTIRGCTITPIGLEEPYTEWCITIDGIEADLGKFSEAIYKQLIVDAKKQRFQGFRPGTIPPHLEPTYKAYTMDECARETILEAMQQNGIRPFTDARSNFKIEMVSIPPLPLKGSKKTKKVSSSKTKKVKGNNKNSEKKDNGTASTMVDEDDNESGSAAIKENDNSDNHDDDEPDGASTTTTTVAGDFDVVQPQWQKFETMDGAIQGGWKPGQSFSFVATNVKGQRLLKEKDSIGSRSALSGF